MKSIAALLLALLVAACSSGPEATGPAAYVITRSWSSGYEESGTVYADGHVVMDHGDHVERVILPEDQMLNQNEVHKRNLRFVAAVLADQPNCTLIGFDA